MPTTALAPVSPEPIQAVRVTGSSAATPASTRAPESAAQTFQRGVPTMLSAGYQVEWDPSAPNIIYGMSQEGGHNLTTSGTAQDESEGTPQNQPSAITTAVGAWPRDGNIGVYNADGKNVFSAALLSAGGVSQLFTQALIIAGTLYKLVKDATSGFWVIDTTVTVGDAAVVELLGVDSTCPNSTTGGCRVFFQIAAAKRYFQ